MTRIELKDGTAIDVAVAAHTAIAQTIEAAQAGQPWVTFAGQTLATEDIDRVVPDFVMRRRDQLDTERREDVARRAARTERQERAAQ